MAKSEYVRQKIHICICLFLLLLPLPCAHAADEPGAELVQQYNSLMKQTFATAIDLERHSLNYRLAASKQSILKNLRYGLAQEAGAAGGLALAITSDRELNKGRSNLFRINPVPLDNALKASIATGIVAGSGSAFEIGANTLHAIDGRRRGYDSRFSTRYMAKQAKHFDALLAQLEALVAAHPEHPEYKAALAENAMLKELRNAILDEYSCFAYRVSGYPPTKMSTTHATLPPM